MAKTRAQRRSKLQEKRIARDVGGRVQSGSGSSWRAKSDVRKQGALRIEAKYTAYPYYDLKRSTWEKIKDEAIRGGLETPVIQIEFIETGKKYAVLDYKLFAQWFRPTDQVLHIQDLSTFGTQYRLDAQAINAFFTNAMVLQSKGVLALNFSNEIFLAVIEWLDFSTLHKEQL